MTPNPVILAVTTQTGSNFQDLGVSFSKAVCSSYEHNQYLTCGRQHSRRNDCGGIKLKALFFTFRDAQTHLTLDTEHLDEELCFKRTRKGSEPTVKLMNGDYLKLLRPVVLTNQRGSGSLLQTFKPPFTGNVHRKRLQSHH